MLPAGAPLGKKSSTTLSVQTPFIDACHLRRAIHGSSWFQSPPFSPSCIARSRLALFKGPPALSRKAHSAQTTSTFRTGYDEDLRRKLVRRIILYRQARAAADSRAEEKDLVIIGGGVAGYVAAIKAGQAGLKVHELVEYIRQRCILTHC